MSVWKGLLIFGIGAAAGFGSGYLIFKNKYEKIADEEIDEVKKYYLEKDLKRLNEAEKMAETNEKMKEAINSGVQKAKEEKDKIDYSKINDESTVIEDKKEDDEEVRAEEESPEEEEPTKPYMKTEDEFLNDKNEYEKLSLTYFTVDDTLADDCDEMVDVEETISTDIYNQISESDDGDYYVRNPILQVDYEIMKVDQSYKERYGFDY